MSEEAVAVIAVILAASVFDYTNGFHDAANAIATSVSTRALTPRAGLLMAAIGLVMASLLHGPQALAQDADEHDDTTSDTPTGTAPGRHSLRPL